MPSLGGQFIKTGVNDESEALIGKRSRLGRIMMMIFVGSSLTIVPLPIFDGLIATGWSQLGYVLVQDGYNEWPPYSLRMIALILNFFPHFLSVDLAQINFLQSSLD